MASTESIAERFTRETAGHTMTIAHDDGLYRHLRFRGERSFYAAKKVSAGRAA
jgi:hypothetical protein